MSRSATAFVPRRRRARRCPRPAGPTRLALAAAALLGLSLPAQGSPHVWTGGGFVPGVTAPHPLPAGEELQISGAAAKSFTAVVFESLGTVTWTGGPISIGGGASIATGGLWDIAGDLSMSYGGGAAVTFTNTGTLRKGSGAGAATVGNVGSFGFVNSGRIDAFSGTLRLSGANSFLAGTSFTGAGSVEVNSNSSYAGALQSANLRWTGGTQTGAAAVLGGQAEWASNATLAGTWTVAGGATLTATGTGSRALNGSQTVLTVDGTLAWAGSGPLSIGAGAQLVNQGLVDLQTSTSVVYGGGDAVTFNNTGTLRHGGAGIATVGNVGSFGFVNSGQIDAVSGTLRLSGANSFLAGTHFTGAGSVEVNSNSSYAGALQSANLRWTGGTQTGNAAVIGGQVEWASNVTLAGTWTVADGATLRATGTGNRALNGSQTVLRVDGTLAWAGSGPLSIGAGAQLVNDGLLDFQAGTSVSYGGGAPVGVANAGTLRVGAPVTVALNTTANLAFTSTGVIDVHAGAQLTLLSAFGNDGTVTGDGTVAVGGSGLLNRGTVAPGSHGVGSLALTGPYTQAANGVFAVDLTDLARFDLFTVSGAVALDGTLALNCLGACSLAVGDSLTILQGGSALAGSFADVTLSGFATGGFDVVYDLAARQVRLVVTEAVTPVPEPGAWALWLGGLGALGWVVRRRRTLQA